MKPVALVSLLYSQVALGFVLPSSFHKTRFEISKGKVSSSSLEVMPIDSAMTTIATVSADIDNISTDNFAEVFTGGIAVMLGGVASSLIVGIFLEFGGAKYDDAVNDSYGSDGDQEFEIPDKSEWTEEQRAEFEALAEKFIKRKISPSGQELVDFMNQFQNDVKQSRSVASSSESTTSDEQVVKEKELSLFSDYD